jgi:hypothetical protein
MIIPLAIIWNYYTYVFVRVNYVEILIDNPNDTVFFLIQDLNQLERWSEKWLVKFNPNKTETMVISSKRNKLYHPLYKWMIKIST